MRNPVAPRGLQFVDIMNIADMNDLENFRIRQATDIERWMDTKFSQLDDKIDVTFEEQETYLKGYIDI